MELLLQLLKGAEVVAVPVVASEELRDLLLLRFKSMSTVVFKPVSVSREAVGPPPVAVAAVWPVE